MDRPSTTNDFQHQWSINRVKGEVSKMRAKIRVKHHIAGLDVTMEDLHFTHSSCRYSTAAATPASTETRNSKGSTSNLSYLAPLGTLPMVKVKRSPMTCGSQPLLLAACSWSVATASHTTLLSCW
jgi:hypothetical protein